MKEFEDVKGYVFDIQHYSIHDGPGIRTTVFLSGCPLRCLWCQNPESQKLKPQLFYLKDKCIGCGRCIPVCPKGAISPFEGKVKTDRNLCDACGKCVEVCPTEARSIVGKEMTALEVYKKVASDVLFYNESGGGVTLSGGEVFVQPEFAAALLKLCKDNNIHTAVETCGFAQWETMEKVLSYVDLVMYDLKHLDTVEHEKCTGVPNETILENLKKIHHKLHLPINIRIPVIPGYNNSIKNMEATAEFIANELDESVKVNLLPYHRMGEGKRQNLEDEMNAFSTTSPTDEEMDKLKKIFEWYGIEASIGG